MLVRSPTTPQFVDLFSRNFRIPQGGAAGMSKGIEADRQRDQSDGAPKAAFRM